MRPSILLLLGLLLASGVSPVDRPNPHATVVGGTAVESQLVYETLEQFAGLGLDLPSLEIRLHQESASCHGNSGTFSSSASPWVVNVCRIDRWVVRHELGHAWTAWNLSETEVASYVDSWQLDSWADSDTPWRRRGSEHAADTIAWGLADDPVCRYSAGGPIAGRIEAFRQLVRIDPPRLACEP